MIKTVEINYIVQLYIDLNFVRVMVFNQQILLS